MKKLLAIITVALLILALAVPVLAAESETEAVAGHQTNFGFYPETLKETLPVMGMGMLGIFLVTCVIVLAVVILSKFGGKDED